MHTNKIGKCADRHAPCIGAATAVGQGARTPCTDSTTTATIRPISQISLVSPLGLLPYHTRPSLDLLPLLFPTPALHPPAPAPRPFPLVLLRLLLHRHPRSHSRLDAGQCAGDVAGDDQVEGRAAGALDGLEGAGDGGDGRLLRLGLVLVLLAALLFLLLQGGGCRLMVLDGKGEEGRLRQTQTQRQRHLAEPGHVLVHAARAVGAPVVYV